MKALKIIFITFCVTLIAPIFGMIVSAGLMMTRMVDAAVAKEIFMFCGQHSYLAIFFNAS